MTGNILQIVPNVAGWRAVYAVEGEKPGTWRPEAWHFPLWALVEDEDGDREVIGLSAGDFVLCVEDEINFRGYLGPDRNIAAWNEDAARYGERQARMATKSDNGNSAVG